jgi:DNA polymerase I-like protein with 3'-5' exonuclease and polymerase domains
MNFDMFDTGPKIKQKPWMVHKKFVLGTVENLHDVIDQCIASGRYAIDLETSGLDNRVYVDSNGIPRTHDEIAGVGLSPDGMSGYYFPLRHASVSTVDGSRTPYACNIPLDVFGPEIKRLTDATEAGTTVAVFHNGKFDHEFLQFNGTGIPWGEWEKPSVWDDTLILCYLRNSRARNKRLKDLSAQPTDMPKESWAMAQCGGPGLGMEMIELYELFGHDTEKTGFNYDFTTLDPTSQEVLWYACSDVICTWLLYPALSPCVLVEDTDGATQKTIYTIEKSAVVSERWMERCLVHVDLNRVAELILLGHVEWWDSIQDVYTSASEILGRDVMPGVYKVLKEIIVLDDHLKLLPEQIDVAERRAKPMYGDKPGLITGRENRKFPATYDVNSPPQLGLMFDEMDVPGLKHTEKSGQVATGKEELDRVIEETGSQFPFMAKIKRFREVNKALSTYLYPVILDVERTDPDGGLMRISFNGRKVDTGRYATPAGESGRRMVGFPKINLQSLPSTAFDPKKPRPECMRRLREIITARPAVPGNPRRYFAAIDFSGEELRIVTNLSGEPKWTKEFFRCSGCDRTFPRDPRSATCSTPMPPPARCPNCGSDKIGDLHTLTGIEVFGADAPTKPNWKVLRGHAKGVNFALCYGGGGQAVCRSIGCEKNEGWRIKNQFDKTYQGLRTWWEVTHKFARKHGFVRTAFGRKYPLPDINNADGFFKSKAERNAVNGPVQGTAGDLIKIAQSLVYKECKKRGWLEKCMMVVTMHDELGFDIDADIMEEALTMLAHTMTANNIFLSRNWIIPFTCDIEIGHDWTVPWDINGMTYKEVRFIGNKKIKSAKDCPPGVDFDSLPSWPEELVPWFRSARGESTDTPLVTPLPLQQPQATQTESAVPMMTFTDSETPPKEPVSSGMVVANIAHLGMPDTTPWEFQLEAPLTPDTVVKLAQAIVKHRGRGMTPLKIRTADGSLLDLDRHLEQLGIKTPVLILRPEFEGMARYLGLIR